MSPLIHAASSRVTALSRLGRWLAPTPRDSGKPTTGRSEVAGARRIRTKELPHFSRKLSAMLGAGMPIVRCLAALGNQSQNPGLKHVVAQVRNRIENGKSLSAALSEFPTLFDDLYISMVKCGEKDGRLPETISRLADFLEASARLRRKVKGAMAYPLVVLFIAVGITALMLVFVVPVLANVYDSLEADLPSSTQFLVAASVYVKQWGVQLVLLVGVCLFLFDKWRRTERGRFSVDWFIMRLPVFGDLNRKIAAARFARAFSDLIRGGVTILDALEVGAGAAGNMVAVRLVRECSHALIGGERLSSAMAGRDVFPETFVEMLQAGEETGKIDEMMDCIGDFYEAEVEAAIAGLAALLEPMLMVLLGILIGGMVVCLFMPIFLIPNAI